MPRAARGLLLVALLLFVAGVPLAIQLSEWTKARLETARFERLCLSRDATAQPRWPASDLALRSVLATVALGPADPRDPLAQGRHLAVTHLGFFALPPAQRTQMLARLPVCPLRPGG